MFANGMNCQFPSKKQNFVSWFTDRATAYSGSPGLDTIIICFPFHSLEPADLQIHCIKFNTTNVYWVSTIKSQTHSFGGIVGIPSLCS